MANITRFDPFFDADNLFRGLRFARREAEPQMKLEVEEDDKNYTIHAEVPATRRVTRARSPECPSSSETDRPSIRSSAPQARYAASTATRCRSAPKSNANRRKRKKARSYTASATTARSIAASRSIRQSIRNKARPPIKTEFSSWCCRKRASAVQPS